MDIHRFHQSDSLYIDWVNHVFKIYPICFNNYGHKYIDDVRDGFVDGWTAGFAVMCDYNHDSLDYFVLLVDVDVKNYACYVYNFMDNPWFSTADADCIRECIRRWLGGL